MSYKIEVIPHTLQFKRPAGTSRGVYTKRQLWYLKVTDEKGNTGMGECAPLLKLSCDHTTDEAYEQRLREICREEEQRGAEAGKRRWFDYPSVDFGLQTAFRHLRAGDWALEDTPFSRGERSIRINGLVWMGNYEYMFRQIKEKIEKGFECIKLKIGAIDFEEEFELLKYIRSQFSQEDIELRVDANGAFRPQEALQKLDRLSKLHLHSIEQPIAAGQWEEMRRLTEQTPLPIALDEELIGCNTDEGKAELLDFIQPQYIILKPSLHSHPDKWVELAEERNIGWWATSALESNIGLNAVAQWAGKKEVTVPQGLGTGQLFVENAEVPLRLEGDRMSFIPKNRR